MTQMVNYLSMLLGFAFLEIVRSIAPPHPDFSDEYRKIRRRHLEEKINDPLYNSTISELRLLSPELCEDLTHHECRRLDDRFAEHSHKTRRIIEGTGTVKTLILLVRFSDHVNRKLPTREDVHAMWNAQEGEEEGILPTGSIGEYLKTNSYGNLVIDAHVKDWIVTDDTELHYSFGRSGLTRDLSKALHPVLEVLDALGEDFSQYDQDGDGVLDSVVFLHSGFPAEVGGWDCYTGQNHIQRIWSHAVSTYSDEWTSYDGQYTLRGYMVASALRGTCGYALARIGVPTHEFIHTWGIPDIYDTAGDWVGSGCGHYDIMSNPYGIDGLQTNPGNMGPWTKLKSGWLQPIEITEDGEYEVEASFLNENVYMIKNKFAENEYLLIENRQALQWDSLIPGSGILIWHIDDNLENNSERGYPGQYAWPGNGKHYRVAVAQADREYHLEKGENTGDENDFWSDGQELGPGPFEWIASDFTKYPNTNSYAFGNIFLTNIRIYDISQSGLVMSFKVEGLSPMPVPTNVPSELPMLETTRPLPAPTRTPTQFPTFPPTLSPTIPPTIPPTFPIFNLSPQPVRDNMNEPEPSQLPPVIAPNIQPSPPPLVRSAAPSAMTIPVVTLLLLFFML
mmetsp:Transcript_6258/g.9621  ORF Transcript_6258/g.9621 Transcript_6258/m.9621 type:complete len:621 (+) Transcript_6258:254-2116(+)